MNRLRKTDYIIIAVLIALIAFIAFMVVRGDNAETNSGENAVAPTAAAGTLSEPDYTAYNGKRIGILTGSSFEPITFEKFPDSEYFYFDDITDLVTALINDKIDAFAEDEPTVNLICRQQKEVGYLKKELVDDKYCFGFQKGTERSEKLRGEFNAMLDELKASGELDSINEKWFSTDESVKVYDDSELSGENGELAVCTGTSNPPFCYMADGKYKGISVELVTLFARKYGYSIKFDGANVSSGIAGLISGKYDVIAGCLSVTEERRESMDFSDSFYDGGIVLAVRASEAGGQTGSQPSARVKTVKDYAGKKIGVQTGTVFDEMIKENIPDAEISYYNSYNDLLSALKAGIIDGFAVDEPIVKYMMTEDSAVDYLKDKMDDYSFGFAFSKSSESEALCNEFNNYIKKIKSDGTLAEIDSVWFGTDESKKVIPDTSTLSGEKGKLSLATEAANAPFVYISNNNIIGYEIDIAYRFCKEYGYGLEMIDMNFDGIIPAVSSGKNDFGCATITITEERRESVNFSEPHYDGGSVLAVRASDLESTAAAPQTVEDRTLGYYADNGKIGAITGGLYEIMIRERYPQAEILQYNSQPDLAIALSEGKIDAFTCPKSAAEDFMAADSSLTYLNEIFMEIPYGFAFKKMDGENKLRDQMNQYLAKIHADGTYDDIVDTWFGTDESKKTVDLTGLDSAETTLRYITASTMQPYSYIKDGQNAGLEVDLVARFCKEYGYGLRIDNADFAGLIPGIAGGTYDIASGNIMITEERAQSVDFSDVYYTGEAVSVVRKETLPAAQEVSPDEAPEKTGFIEGIKESFNKNFVREDRYKLILEGIGTTCIITVLSVVCGSVLAFLICLFRRADSVLSNKICDLYVKLLQGTPMVVLLMILYYVIFGKSGMAAMWVAVIGFSLNFGAYVSETLRSGIDGIDDGQREAALALGFSENQAFFRFIFPQAAVRQLPVYRGEVISLLKNTSIVGYIAIQDLTKMSDIIRSRTYEAFFPLIVTAVIYFILAWIISIILKLVLKQIDPRSKKRGVKGVTLK